MAPDNDLAVALTVTLLWLSLATGVVWLWWVARQPSDWRSVRRAQRQREAFDRIVRPR